MNAVNVNIFNTKVKDFMDKMQKKGRASSLQENL